MSHSFLDADVPDIVRKLKVDEKIALLGAPNWWNTTAISRLEIPAIRMSDGPNASSSVPNCSFLTYCHRVSEDHLTFYKLQRNVYLSVPLMNP
jgi:Phosphatidylinositol-glycan biosynthesis class S protein